ncbi:MAG: type II secretion system minor pseudopilin GspJ [Pseudomonadales bacterium]|nr:type II secretion system minor pseudopilin GspJ [Pseudomonadales bacterium]
MGSRQPSLCSMRQRSLGRIQLNGFTLVELLIAIVLFSIVSIGSYQVLSSVISSHRKLSSHNEKFEGLRRAANMLTRDLQQVQPRTVTNAYGDQENALILESSDLSRLVLSSGGWDNPLMAARGTVGRIEFFVEDEVLIKRLWLVLDALDQESHFDMPLVKGVSEFQIRALNPEQRWLSFWPMEDMPATELPRALEVELVVAELGTIKRVLELLP